MASIFKRGSDRKNRHASYWFEYTDHQGARRRRKGFTDKALTEQLAAKTEQEEMLRMRGLIDPEEETKVGHKTSPLGTHLEDFRRSLSKTTEKYKKLVSARLDRIVEEADLQTISDWDIPIVEEAIRNICEEDGLGHK